MSGTDEPRYEYELLRGVLPLFSQDHLPCYNLRGDVDPDLRNEQSFLLDEIQRISWWISGVYDATDQEQVLSTVIQLLGVLESTLIGEAVGHSIFSGEDVQAIVCAFDFPRQLIQFLYEITHAY